MRPFYMYSPGNYVVPGGRDSGGGWVNYCSQSHFAAGAAYGSDDDLHPCSNGGTEGRRIRDHRSRAAWAEKCAYNCLYIMLWCMLVVCVLGVCRFVVIVRCCMRFGRCVSAMFLNAIVSACCFSAQCRCDHRGLTRYRVARSWHMLWHWHWSRVVSTCYDDMGWNRYTWHRHWSDTWMSVTCSALRIHGTRQTNSLLCEAMLLFVEPQ